MDIDRLLQCLEPYEIWGAAASHYREAAQYWEIVEKQVREAQAAATNLRKWLNEAEDLVIAAERQGKSATEKRTAVQQHLCAAGSIWDSQTLRKGGIREYQVRAEEHEMLADKLRAFAYRRGM